MVITCYKQSYCILATPPGLEGRCAPYNLQGDSVALSKWQAWGSGGVRIWFLLFPFPDSPLVKWQGRMVLNNPASVPTYKIPYSKCTLVIDRSSWRNCHFKNILQCTVPGNLTLSLFIFQLQRVTFTLENFCFQHAWPWGFLPWLVMFQGVKRCTEAQSDGGKEACLGISLWYVYCHIYDSHKSV